MCGWPSDGGERGRATRAATKQLFFFLFAGLVLQSKEQPAVAPVRLFYPNPSDPRTRHPAFPKTYVTEEELMQARRSGARASGLAPGLRLVGFKPAASLAPHHALRAASFLYPRDAPGAARKTSSPLFVALHGALLSTNSLAVCEWVRSSKSEPRLVAVLPQREHRTAHGQQVQPPGMSMVYLPYADDIRYPEKDPWLTNPEVRGRRAGVSGVGGRDFPACRSFAGILSVRCSFKLRFFTSPPPSLAPVHQVCLAKPSGLGRASDREPAAGRLPQRRHPQSPPAAPLRRARSHRPGRGAVRGHRRRDAAGRRSL